MPDREPIIVERSEDVQEILSYIPHWIIRWGITVILASVLLLLVGSWYIQYPDIIQTRITVTTERPPANLVARANGQLMLYIEDDDHVEQGKLLAMIRNPAVKEDVFKLKEQLIPIAAALEHKDSILLFELDSTAQLGEIQSDYSTFLQACYEYRFYGNENNYQEKVGSLQKQILHYQTLNNKLKKQKLILADELDIAASNYEKDKTLFEQNAIAEVGLKQSKSIYLQKKYDLESADINVIRNEIQIQDYRKSIADINQQYKELGRTYLVNMKESFNRLKSRIAAWEQQYLFVAPFKGRVSLFKFWGDNQFVNAGEHVMNVIPESGDIIGKAYTPGARSGKIGIGQQVRIKFDGYPFNEFGAVEGQVQSISRVSHENKVLVNIDLINGLETNYGKKLEFRQQMEGTAEIITENLRLLERIFYNLKDVLSQQKG